MAHFMHPCDAFLLPCRAFREKVELPHVFSWGDVSHFSGLLGLVGKLSCGFLGRPLPWSQIIALKSSLFWPEIVA